MNLLKHPSEYIKSQLCSDIRKDAAEAERLLQLHPNQLKIIYEEQWLNLFVPKKFNGLGVSLPEALYVEEALAYTDGALGWTVTLCAGAAWFVGFLNPELSEIIFKDKKVCFAGSGKISGTASKKKDGFLINGKWDYASGSPFATAFTANCVIEENGKTLLNEVGKPIIQSFLFFKNEVNLIKNWNRIGMIATGSNGFSVTDVLVPFNRTFIIDSNHTNLPDPIFKYPFLALAQTTLAVNSSGMAMRFLDICKNDFTGDKYNMLQQKLSFAYSEIDTARKLFFDVAEKSWLQCKEQNLSSETLQAVGILSQQLAHKSLRAVDELYPFCGMQAANPDTEMNRVWRNVHTASQHSIFNT